MLTQDPFYFIFSPSKMKTLAELGDKKGRAKNNKKTTKWQPLIVLTPHIIFQIFLIEKQTKLNIYINIHRDKYKPLHRLSLSLLPKGVNAKNAKFNIFSIFTPVFLLWLPTVTYISETDAIFRKPMPRTNISVKMRSQGFLVL